MSPRNAAVNQRMRAHAQDRILRAARTLFTERGYERTTFAQIAAEAQVSAGLTVYHFKTKHHLVQALADRLFHAPIVARLKAMPADIDTDHALATLIDTVLRAAAAEPVVVALHLGLLLRPDVVETLADAEHDYENELGALNARILAADQDPAVVVPARRALLMGAVYGMLSPYQPISMETARAMVFDHYGLDHHLTTDRTP